MWNARSFIPYLFLLCEANSSVMIDSTKAANIVSIQVLFKKLSVQSGGGTGHLITTGVFR